MGVIFWVQGSLKDLGIQKLTLKASAVVPVFIYYLWRLASHPRVKSNHISSVGAIDALKKRKCGSHRFLGMVACHIVTN